jgi:cytochrome c-type biogenesis protein CcmH/NrfG
MRLARSALLVLVLAAALVPELRQYGADRRLRDATAVFRAVVMAPPPGVDRARALDWVVANALDEARALPGDSRPLILVGSARLVARRGEEALGLYRRALALGERAEIDLNLARAHALAGQADAAHVALVRTGWVSPALLRSLPKSARLSVRRDLKLAGWALRDGRLTVPPPLPHEDLPAG